MIKIIKNINKWYDDLDDTNPMLRMCVGLGPLVFAILIMDINVYITLTIFVVFTFIRCGGVFINSYEEFKKIYETKTV